MAAAELVNISLICRPGQSSSWYKFKMFTLKPEAHNVIAKDYKLLSQTKMATIFLYYFEIVRKRFTDANFEGQYTGSGLYLSESAATSIVQLVLKMD